ncbi:MAG TPA: division/cell wall cluster transcriptional repressor MraZ [Gammaproteobacteria bacterium]|nr:division/cell wall cluster transcriptional repressor MraZ [Xanthomonadales bacterium]HOP22602.1 division/cell wall cluster transcriptional repressor MraZ [Gammaproteobacteria bacterium]MCB1594369.1 division/cell wall cluster transcriptional repressor MraZ [Xanthomonadales bacterium]MCB1603242.1 division/cell wall cluster transcriptional repressor MraZ [Xanthomonadales bacterium]HPI95306.1 division/cell wall cluster transcriptional repressor MraZ [Gammaproteobacteria bacterium]
MFFGETAVNLDAKGRLAIPVRYRELIAGACNNKLVLTYNPFEISSLLLYPEEEWDKLKDQIMALSSFNDEHRNLQLKLVGSAFHIEPDKGFRLQLPVNMRQEASMDKKVVMLGMGKKFEIWNDDALMKVRRAVINKSGDEVTDEMKKIVL